MYVTPYTDIATHSAQPVNHYDQRDDMQPRTVKPTLHVAACPGTTTAAAQEFNTDAVKTTLLFDPEADTARCSSRAYSKQDLVLAQSDLCAKLCHRSKCIIMLLNRSI